MPDNRYDQDFLDKLEAALAGASQGATFGFGDEIEAGLDTAGKFLVGKPYDYAAKKKQILDRNKALESMQPAAYMAGDIGSAIAVPIPGMGAARAGIKAGEAAAKGAAKVGGELAGKSLATQAAANVATNMAPQVASSYGRDDFSGLPMGVGLAAASPLMRMAKGKGADFPTPWPTATPRAPLKPKAYADLKAHSMRPNMSVEDHIDEAALAEARASAIYNYGKQIDGNRHNPKALKHFEKIAQRHAEHIPEELLDQISYKRAADFINRKRAAENKPPLDKQQMLDYFRFNQMPKQQKLTYGEELSRNYIPDPNLSDEENFFRMLAMPERQQLSRDEMRQFFVGGSNKEKIADFKKQMEGMDNLELQEFKNWARKAKENNKKNK